MGSAKLNVTHEEFEEKSWRYYLLLENSFIHTFDYIHFDEGNFKTFSFNLMRQLTSICIEIETSLKIITSSTNNNIKQYLKILIKNYPEMENMTVSTVINRTDIRPFHDISTRLGDKDPAFIWWQGYNSLKHDRFTSLQQANFENVLHALATLFLLDMYILKLSTEDGKMDCPSIGSKFFTTDAIDFRCHTSDHVVVSIEKVTV